MKTSYLLLISIIFLFSACEKTTGGYYCIKNDTQHDIKIEHIGGYLYNENKFNIAPSQVYEAFYVSSDFETLPYITDTFYVFIEDKKYMDIFDLKNSLIRTENYVFDKTKETKNTSYYIFNINENYINSLIEMK